MKYMISYDLNKHDKNYDGLIEAIKKVSTAWCCPCKSTWMIHSSYTDAAEVYKRLSSEIDQNDYLVVCEITGNCYGQMDKETADFISKNFVNSR